MEEKPPFCSVLRCRGPLRDALDIGDGLAVGVVVPGKEAQDEVQDEDRVDHVADDLPGWVVGLARTLVGLQSQVVVAFPFPGSSCVSVLGFSGFSGAPISLARDCTAAMISKWCLLHPK